MPMKIFKLTLHSPCDEALTRTQPPFRGIPDKNETDHIETIRRGLPWCSSG